MTDSPDDVSDNRNMTDENGNTYDQVDLAPFRWRKPAKEPTEPLVKPKNILVKSFSNQNDDSYERLEDIAESDVKSPVKSDLESEVPEVKNQKRNIFTNLFKRKPKINGKDKIKMQ